MLFGKTLNDVVKSDWRCHAVAYMELKRALNEGDCPSCDVKNSSGADDLPNEANDGHYHPATCESNNDDVHSVHTETSYRISDQQVAIFFLIYEDSIMRLNKFYDDRVQWARGERIELEQAVGRCIAGDKKSKAYNDTDTNEGTQSSDKVEVGQSFSSTKLLVNRIDNLSRDVGLVLEFLALNVTAFSKIIKKFDKRTGSSHRETKMKELKAQYPYLYSGGELKECKNLCSGWKNQLQVILQQDPLVVGYLRGIFAHSSNSSSSDTDSRRSSQFEARTKGPPNINGENPQDRCETKEDRAKQEPKMGAYVHFEEYNEYPSAQICHIPQRVQTTNESRVLENMISCVREELCLQKADSAFFDGALDNNPPPSFMTSEVELAGALGEGEFCKIYEVHRFRVPESCHICFLHRGYKDPSPIREIPSSVIIGNINTSQPDKELRIPSCVMIGNINTSQPDKELRPLSAKNEGRSAPPTKANAACRSAETSPKPVSNFSFTHDANISDYDDLEDDHEDDGFDHPTRGFMKDHCLRNGEARYAIKRIRSCLVGEEEITLAAIDLAREAEFLAVLKHPNIIKIRGTINVPGHPEYSLILDRLYDTLEVQIKKWQVDITRHQGKLKGLIGRNKMVLNKIWNDRLVAAYDLARAMAYLHSRRILHRDIKPANIGFDIRGDIKIFDFGLAKELKPIECEGKDQYHSSGMAGTRRYMAPEMAQARGYGLSADVYSFGVLLWEMLTLRDAYEKYSRNKHYKEVVVEGKRPKIPKSWSSVINNLIERCWHKQPLERPSFTAVCELIKFGIPNEFAASDRSDDLLMRSYKSKQGDVDESAHTDESSDHIKVDTSLLFCSDLLSRSIRIKNACVHDSKAFPTEAVRYE